MPIKVSQQIKRQLPEGERKDIESWLEAKSWKTCFLCQRPIDVAVDDLVADHDDAVTVGGETDRDNLNVVHVRCNSQKGGLTTAQARAILSLERHMEAKSPGLKYGEVLDHFGIDPKPISIDDRGDSILVDLGEVNGSESYRVFSESNPRGTFRSAYISLPRSAIFNDDDCQPRSIKLAQLRQIYLDIHTNPLHEPPSCRVVSSGDKQQLLMFDGQHKTLACWMLGREHVVAKVYLDLSLDDAVTLVNSIQSKIKKLPLTPFELVAKLDQEHQAKFAKYRNATDPDKVSELGFVRSLPMAERSKARQGLEAAVVKNVVDADDPLRLYDMYVRGAGLPAGQSRLTEAAFRNKVLKTLLLTAPLPVPLAQGQQMRDRERDHVLRALNFLAEQAFPASDGVPIGKHESERARRMSYQSALQYISLLIRRTFRAVLEPNDEAWAMMEKEPSPEAWERIEAAIKRMVGHPIWTTDFEKSGKTRAVESALKQNQNAAQAFQAVGLTPGYVLGGDKLSGSWWEDEES